MSIFLKSQGNGSSGGSIAWGAITGTLSNQTDLKNALDLKEDILTFSTGLDRTGNIITNTITQYTDALAISAIKSDSDWNATNWDTAYGWGDHAGLYDAIGTASGLIGTHESTYNHDNYNTAYSWGNHADAGYLTTISGLSHTTLSDIGSNTHAQIDTFISSKGNALGLATLDGGGKVPVAQLPSAIMIYKGTWDASTNSPTLIDGTGDTGDVYRVSVAGIQDLGSGSISFDVGDYVIYNGTIWEKSDTTDAVTSVNGYTGIVVLDTGDFLENGNLFFTDARAQSALSGLYEVPLTFSTGLNRTGNTITSTITQYTDTLARQSISETVTGLDYNNTSGVLSLTSGYVIPTTTEESNWNTAYSWGNHADAGYLTSLTGAVLTDQSTPQTVGTTSDRLLKLWATDITCTNAIEGSVTGNAGTVTNGVYTTDANWTDLTDGGETNLHIHDDRYYTETELSSEVSGSAGCSLIGIDTLGTPTWTNQCNFNTLFGSAGRATGGEITDAGSQTVNIAAGTGFIKANDSDTDPLLSFNWTASNGVSIATDTVKYIGVEYNSGTPQIVIKTSNTWNLDTEFPLGSVINQSDDLYINNNPWWVTDGLTNIIERLQADGYIVRDNYVGGLLIGTSSSNTTRKPTLSAGTVWSRLNEFSITDKDCSTGDTFYGFYRDGGTGWSRTIAKTDIDDFYDDDSGTLQPLDNNKFVNFWVFLEIDGGSGNSKLMVIYPQIQHNTAVEAEDEVVPIFPASWYEHGILVGRIIIKEGVTIPISVQTAFGSNFDYTVAADHANLTSLTWTTAGHTGTASTLAGFNGAGAATEYTEANYLLVDGTRPLTSNWDIGSFKITAETFESDIAIGTAPFIVTSTTLVNNLNADLLDGHEWSEVPTQYTDALARSAISETVTGLDYDNLTGIFSLTSGYVIPTTTEESNWNTAYGWARS